MCPYGPYMYILGTYHNVMTTFVHLKSININMNIPPGTDIFNVPSVRINKMK